MRPAYHAIKPNGIPGTKMRPAGLARVLLATWPTNNIECRLSAEKE